MDPSVLARLDSVESKIDSVESNLSKLSNTLDTVLAAVRGLGDVNELRRDSQQLRDEIATLKIGNAQLSSEIETKNEQIHNMEVNKSALEASSYHKGKRWEDDCKDVLTSFFPTLKNTSASPHSGDYQATIEGYERHITVVIDAKDKQRLLREDWDKLSHDLDHVGAKFGVLLWKANGKEEPLVLDPRRMLEDQRTSLITDKRLIACNIAGLGQALCLLFGRHTGEDMTYEVKEMHKVCHDYADYADKLLSPIMNAMPSTNDYNQMMSALKHHSRLGQWLDPSVQLPVGGKRQKRKLSP